MDIVDVVKILTEYLYQHLDCDLHILSYMKLLKDCLNHIDKTLSVKLDVSKFRFKLFVKYLKSIYYFGMMAFLRNYIFLIEINCFVIVQRMTMYISKMTNEKDTNK